jgi:hypothetical protein
MREFRYEDVSVGDLLTSRLSLDKDLVKGYMECLGIQYGEGRTVPSSIFAIYKPWYEAFGGRVAHGTVHLKQKMEYFCRVEVGDEFDVQVKVTDKYRKKDRDYLVHETTFMKGGKLCCKQITTQIWAFVKT